MFERFAKAAKYAVVVAQEEAREMRSPSVAVEHMLLGIAASPDQGVRKVLEDNGITARSIRESLVNRQSGEPLGEDDAAALRSIGIDLEAVRASLEATFGADALDRSTAAEKPRGRFGFGDGIKTGHIPFDRDTKKVLELSLREAVSRGDKSIEAAHVLLGVLRGTNEPTRELLGGETGIETLRRALHELLDRAA